MQSVGHVIGLLIDEVSIVPDKELGYQGYCCFSEWYEVTNDHFQWQKGSTNPELLTMKFAGTVAPACSRIWRERIVGNTEHW